MRLARLLIAAAVLAGLGGLVYWSNRSEEAKAGRPDPKAAPKILELKEADIRQIEIRHHEGETTVVKKDDAGKWSITAPQPLAADQTAVATTSVSLSVRAVSRSPAPRLSAMRPIDWTALRRTSACGLFRIR